MTDARQPATGAGMDCPDFEILSCYADGELEAEAVAAVAGHIDRCGRCASLALRLREDFAADEARSGGGVGGSSCAGEEHLVLYASDGLEGPARAAAEAHVVGCDACLQSVVRVRRRLAIAGDFAALIPPAVQHRAGLALERGMRELERETAGASEGVRAAQRHHVGVLERLSNWLRVPVLVPAAVAAGALLAVVTLQHPADRTAGERSRAVAPASATLRVRAVEAQVYSRPSMQAQVIATVKRDTRLEVAGEERGWYEVRLEGGSAGWVAQEAFE